MQKVGILIITLNRSEFLIRQLKYYNKVKSIHPIYIGDSSNNYHKNKLLNEIKSLKDNLNIKYFFLPNYTDREAHFFLAKNCKEKYCTYAGDDDFLIPSSLTESANFLSNNDEFRTAL